MNQTAESPNIASKALEGPSKAAPGGAFNALKKYRDFRLLWLSTLFVGIAFFMQQVAMGWIALDLTNSPLFVGIVAFSSGISFILVAVPAGSYIDQLDRKLIYRTAQGISTVTALMLATLVLTGLVAAWQLPIFAFVTGAVQAVMMPTQQSLAPNLVEKDELSNAVGLMSAGQSLSRVVGPTLAGSIIGFVSTGGSFLVQAMMIGTAFIMAAMIRIPPRTVVSGGPKGIDRVLSGFRIVLGDPELRALFALGFVTPILILPFVQFLNVFARDILDIGASGLGYMMATSGIGSVIGALFVAQRKIGPNTAKAQPYLLIVTALAVMGIAYSTFVPLTFFLLFMEGLLAAIMLSTNMALVQMRITDEIRGRVLGAYSLGFGLLPIAALPVGVLADLVSTQFAVACSATLALLVALWMSFRSPAIRSL